MKANPDANQDKYTYFTGHVIGLRQLMKQRSKKYKMIDEVLKTSAKRDEKVVVRFNKS